MAWTAPRTWVTGEIVTAAIQNTHVRDNFLQTGPALVSTAGDLLFATGANALARLGIGAAGQVLRTNSGATAPEWGSPPITILDRDMSSVAITNNSSEQTIYSDTIPANELGTDGGFRLKLAGDFLKNASGNFILRIKLGGVTVLTSNPITPTSLPDDRQWVWEILCLNKSATTQTWSTWFKAVEETAGGEFPLALGGDSGLVFGVGMHDTGTVDTTAAVLLDVTFDWSVANVALSFRKELAILELLPAA